MGEFFKFIFRFFHGWRRKIGIVTLLMACVAMCVWCRSHVFTDEISSGRIDYLSIGGGQVKWWHILVASADAHTASQWSWTVYPFEIDDWLDELPSGWRILAIYKTAGFTFVKGDAPNGQTLTFVVVSVLWLVIPLTLTSLWLLLSKPRKSTSKKITEPPP